MEYQTHSPTLSSVGGQQINTVAALAVYAGDAHEVFCLDVRDKFYSDPASSVATDGITIISRVTGGRWHRRCQPDVYWMSQSELWLDASAGADTNPGTSTSMIKTVGEFYRRTGGNQSSAAGVLYTADALSDAESALFYQMTANNGRQWTLVDGSLPVTPHLWYDARDINGNGDGNKGLIDGNAYAALTWKNKGSKGSSGDLTIQASTITYRAVASAGKLRNSPALEGAGAGYMKSGAVAGLVGPTAWVLVVKLTSGAATARLCDGRTVNAGLETTAGSPAPWILFAGSSANWGPGAVINQYHSFMVILSPPGTACQDGAVNPASGGTCGTNVADGATLFAWNDGSFPWPGQIVSAMLIDAGSLATNDPAAFEGWFRYNYGSFPQ